MATEKDMAKAIEMLTAFIKPNKKELAYQTFQLIRYHFNSLHWLEYMESKKEAMTSIEIPFNGAYIANSESFRREIKEDIKNVNSSVFLKNIKNLCNDAQKTDRALSMLMFLKYHNEILKIFCLYEKSKPSERMGRKVTKKWLKAKIQYEKEFFKLFFSEVDILQLDNDEIKVCVERYIEIKNYPPDFYKATLESIAS